MGFKIIFTTKQHNVNFKGGGSLAIDSLFNVPPIVLVGSVFGPCFVEQYLV